MSESVGSVAYRALNLAEQANRDIAKHEEICAERYAGIHTAVAELKTDLKADTDKIWGFAWKVGGAGFSILLAMIGFLIIQTLAANDKRADAQQDRIAQLQAQVAESHK